MDHESKDRSTKRERFNNHATKKLNLNSRRFGSLDNRMDDLVIDPISGGSLGNLNNKEPLIKSSLKPNKKSIWRRSAADDALDFDGFYRRARRTQSEMYDSDNMPEYFSYQGTPRGSYRSPSFASSSSMSYQNVRTMQRVHADSSPVREVL